MAVEATTQHDGDQPPQPAEPTAVGGALGRQPVLGSGRILIGYVRCLTERTARTLSSRSPMASVQSRTWYDSVILPGREDRYLVAR